MKIDYEKISEYVKSHYPDIVAHKLRIAEEVMANKYLFDSPNDLERTTEMVHFEGDIDWEHSLNGDKEFAYQMSRHRYFVDLAEAYHMTGKVEYARRIVEICTDFITRCPYAKSSLAWRTLETGLRMEYWTRAFDMIEDTEYFTDEFRSLVEESMNVHAKVLVEGKIDHHRLSNWGVLQDHGLFAVSLYLHNDEYVKIALDRMYEEARLQAMADGVHWEVSTTYHNEVLGCFIDAIMRANARGITLDEEFLAIVHKMARVDLYWIKPDYNGPLYGDSDLTDLRGILSISALLFNDAEMRYIAGDVMDYDHVWRLGDEELARYESMAGVAPDYTSVSLKDSGNYIMRSAYGENANYMIFHNSNTGGGHAHEDKLSFELNVDGDDILVDTGRYTYVWNNARAEIKSYRAHNTTAVDNSHFVRANWWDYMGYIAKSIRSDMTIAPDYEMVEGAHTGYMNRLKGGLTTMRSIIWIKPDVYIVLDEFEGKGKHMYSSFWNFAPNSKVEVDKREVTTRSGKSTALIRFLDDDITLTREVGMYSEHYNAVCDIDRVVASRKAKANAHMTAIIVTHPEKYSDLSIESVPVKDAYGHVLDEAMAFKMTLGGDTYTFIAKYKEYIRLLLADGKPATGKFTLYKNDDYNIIKW